MIEEDSLVSQERTCEDIIMLILDNVFLQGTTWNGYTTEEILLAVQGIQHKVRAEICYCELKNVGKHIFLKSEGKGRLILFFSRRPKNEKSLA